MRKNGYSLIEIIIAIALAAIFLPALGTIFSLSLTSASEGEKYSLAYQLAQEGMEAIYYLKSQNDEEWDWVSTPANTDVDEYYQPSQTGGNWLLGDKTKTSVVTKVPFTRQVTLGPVRRCLGEICDDGLAPLDPYTRLVIVTVSWEEKGTPQTVELHSYVTQH